MSGDSRIFGDQLSALFGCWIVGDNIAPCRADPHVYPAGIVSCDISDVLFGRIHLAVVDNLTGVIVERHQVCMGIAAGPDDAFWPFGDAYIVAVDG